MKRMSDAEYKWKSFKMTWLVPNWGRARGPAFWIWRVMDWWHWNMNMRYTTGWLYNTVDFFKNKVFKKATPWLTHARDFMEVFINENGTKLIDYDSMSFTTRTRDAHQYYFNGKCSLFGKVKIWQSQYFDDLDESQNLFENAIFGEKPLREERKLIWEGRVLTKAQKIAAIEDVMKLKQVGFFTFFVNCILYGLKKLGRKEIFTGKRDCGTIYKVEIPAIINDLLGEKKELYKLTDEETTKVEAYIVEKMK